MMNRFCIAIFFWACTGPVWADSEHAIERDWETLSGSDGCVAWTVTKTSPNGQLWMRALPDGTQHIELKGADWLESSEANPFRDRGTSGAVITIGELGSPWVQLSYVRFLGARNIVPHFDTTSTKVFSDLLSLGSASDTDIVISVNFEQVGTFSGNGYPEALEIFNRCAAELVDGP